MTDLSVTFVVTRAFARAIIADPFAGNRAWTYQGLGMLRTYVDGDGVYRLNVWHGPARIANISNVHTHPWDLQSLIINGELRNVRWTEKPRGAGVTPCHMRAMTLGCGTHRNGAILGKEFDVTLYKGRTERYRAGDMYVQRRDEIHCSEFDESAVSLNIRTNKREDQSATVFWDRGSDWVDAKGRPASAWEIKRACDAALERWTN